MVSFDVMIEKIIRLFGFLQHHLVPYAQHILQIHMCLAALFPVSSSSIISNKLHGVIMHMHNITVYCPSF